MPIAPPAPPPPPPQILTDNEGRFAFMNLTRGNYTLTATKSGYTAGAYGRVRPGGPNRPVQLDDGEKMPDATIRLFKLGSIAGTVTDDAGEPVVSTMICVYRRTLVAGRTGTHARGRPDTHRRSRDVSNRQSDAWRIHRRGAPRAGHRSGRVPRSRQSTESSVHRARPDVGLADSRRGWAGDRSGCEVPAATSNGISGDIAAAPDASGRIVGFSTVYYPNAPTASGAEVISIASGEQRTGIDLALRRVPTVTISGLITSPDGAAADHAIRLVPTDNGDIIQEPEAAVAMSDASGMFMFLGVPSGRYLVQVVRMPRRTGQMDQVMLRPGAEGLPMPAAQFQAMQAAQAAMEPLLWATVPVSVSDSDVQGLALTLREGLTVSGKLEFSGSRPQSRAATTDPGANHDRACRRSHAWSDQGPPSARAAGRTIHHGRPIAGAVFHQARRRGGRMEFAEHHREWHRCDGQSHRPFQRQRQQCRRHVQRSDSGLAGHCHRAFRPALKLRAWSCFPRTAMRGRTLAPARRACDMTRASGTVVSSRRARSLRATTTSSRFRMSTRANGRTRRIWSFLARAGDALFARAWRAEDGRHHRFRTSSRRRSADSGSASDAGTQLEATERAHGPFVEEPSSGDRTPQQVRDTRSCATSRHRLDRRRCPARRRIERAGAICAGLDPQFDHTG